jgi:plasmid stabilization system protein ParE
MLRIHKSPEAENDLDEIWWYIAQDNPGNADKFIDEMVALRLSGYCMA